MLLSCQDFAKADQPNIKSSDLKEDSETDQPNIKSSDLKEDCRNIIKDDVHINLKCNREHCLLYGINFSKYIADLHPVKSLILPGIVDGNHFFD